MNTPSAYRRMTIHPRQKIVVVQFGGPMESQDVVRWIDDALADAAFSRQYDGVVDLREAVFQQMRPDKVQALAAYMIQRNFTHGRWAIIVDSPVGTALSLIYTRVAGQHHPIQLFSTVEAAAGFLERPSMQIGALLAENATS